MKTLEMVICMSVHAPTENSKFIVSGDGVVGVNLLTVSSNSCVRLVGDLIWFQFFFLFFFA